MSKKPPLTIISDNSDESSNSSSDTSTTSSSIPTETTTSSIPSSSKSTISVKNINLKEEFENLDCSDENFYTNDCNKFLLKKELVEREYLEENDGNDYLYPNLNDKNFNIKIATKKEFNDTKYDGTIYENIKKQADILAKADFELQPHQAFVKNFMSFQTPYSSLLLYHGLGSGKTCSAIGVCEEMRDYIKRTGISKGILGLNKGIIIVASENVQDNFKLQLFDERKLKQVNGVWSMRGCIGNKLLKEINPMNAPMTKERVISEIKNLINTYYVFMGYVQFANYIIKTMNYEAEFQRKKQDRKTREPGDKRQKTQIELLKDIKIELNSRVLRRVRNEFNNRLVVIDEVHNIRKSDNKENKKVAVNLELLVKAAQNMRFLLLSATPMYNNYKEIVWLLNLMNTNDRRGRVDVSDIFDKNGNFKKGGEEMLVRKATGYISFVRGENPYTFPYRVYPSVFAKDKTFPDIKYPTHQMNLKKIGHEDKKRILSLYLTKIGGCNNCGKCQYCCYKYIIYNLRNKSFSITTKQGVVREMPSFENMESFGYTLLQTPIESLIISYPVDGLKDFLSDLPDEPLSEEISPSMSEVIVENVEQNEDDALNQNEDDEALDNQSDDEKSVDSSSSGEVFVMKPIKRHHISEDSSSEEFIFKKPKQTKPVTPSRKNTSAKNNIIQQQTQNELKSPESDNTNKKSEESSSYTVKVVPRSDQGQGTSGGGDSSSSVKVRNINIQPNQLTGKAGLKRMMNFEDNTTPPMKGNFEYKQTTLTKYGKIFSQNEVGKYSAKIKCILDNIYNANDDKVSDGVILIYSQFIDSGLVPMALALEEMGFTRYGETGIKPLFKNRPTDLVDVRTMKAPENKKDYKPARYSMITGDPRISPNNDFEVKGLTGEDNKDGHKVKVVLISKAGSEGIDLKFIRQVHILDPWYNMNRPEQIIGRAVRNFSHKDLPFELRNVQIFMHGTILDKNVEEAADLYIYRVAEFKAVQIGKVTRVLKETSVDCIINHDQSNFTQEIMSAKLNEPIKQQLSTGETLDDFKIGDSPFSPACDYMASCNYSCRPDSEIDESKLNEDTYDENFIVINSEKILQRIRMLFKESFFYKKDMLLKAIRTPKEYPFVQIYSALTQLIEDENEFIVDKYGRNGRLINIGEYYLFQPIELKDKNISIFERSVPIDYKHDMVDFTLKKEITKPAADKTRIVVQPQQNVLTFPEGERIVEEMKTRYNTCVEYTKESRVERGDDDWYKHCGIVIQKLSKEYPNSQKFLLYFLVAHMIEMLLFEDKIHLMNHIYSLERIEPGTLERWTKDYFEKNSIITGKFTAFICFNLNKPVTMILDSDNKWVKSTHDQQKQIANAKDTLDFLRFNESEYNTIVGFIGYEKGNKDFAFKTKNMASKRDTGARCDQAQKNKNLSKLNEIIGEEKYTVENTKSVKDKKGNVIKEAMSNVEICVFEEMLLRYFDISGERGKKWFFTPEMAIWHKLYTVHV